MRRRSTFLVILIAACALVAVGCGDDDSDESGGGGGAYGSTGAGDGGASGGGATTLQLSADPSGALRFDTTSLEAKPGDVRIVMDNPSDVPHAVEVEGNAVEEVGETVGRGGVSQVSLKDLKAGEYEFLCPVGDHAAEGMEGKLTVK
jgi:plastocyanin